MFRTLFYPPHKFALGVENILFYPFIISAKMLVPFYFKTHLLQKLQKKDTIFTNRICKSNLNGNILYTYKFIDKPI